MIKRFSLCLLLVALVMPAQAFWPFSKTKREVEASEKRGSDQNALAIKSTVNGQPVPVSGAVNVGGTSNSVNVINAPAASPAGYQATNEAHTQSSGAYQNNYSDDYFSKTQLPWSIALIGTGIGIFAIFAAIRYARKTSPAVDAAIGYAEREVADVIRTFEHQARTETDPETLAHTNSTLAELNQARGKITRYKHGKK